MNEDPRQEYTRRMEARQSGAAVHDRRHRNFGNGRLAIAAAAAAMAWLAFSRGVLSPWWLAAPVCAFIGLAVAHDTVLRRLALAQRAAAYYLKALERLDHRWTGCGSSGDRFRDDQHPYAQELDLFGQGSLFELLSTARTRMGENTLAAWLRAPSPPEEVAERQAAVAELRPMLDLREDLAVLCEDVPAGVRPEALAAWGEAPPLLRSRGQRAAAVALTAFGVAGLAVWVIWGISLVFLAALAVDAAVLRGSRRHISRVVHDVESAAQDLALLQEVLARLERERFTSPRLARLRSDLDVEGLPPSARIARLKRIMELLDSRDHLLMRLIGPLLLWTVHLAFAVEQWRASTGPAVRRWLDAVGEMEALASLAGYAYEHPADVFPEFSREGPLFDGEGLAHPLLAEDRAVRNDVSIAGELRVLIVSGSNMSGKSTLLRTVGVNAVLAQAGAPVRALRLRLSPLQPGASIRIVDSLQGGVSRFYAEIMHLRRIVELTRGPVPVLFLLDEFLHGTNSHDRRIGAEAIVRGLVERGAIGLVTTHDLALAHIADTLGPRGANIHFEDRLEDGKLYFDYRVRQGVVRKSNALELMRSVGLDV